MFGQITNKKGDNLYMLTSVSTNKIKPFINVDTWEKCKKLFNGMTIEKEDKHSFTQLVHKKIDEEYNKAEASMRCNSKGWGDDYFMYITIEPLYAQDWE